MNKKLRKLLKNPVGFFKDMHALQPTLRLLGLPGRMELSRSNKNNRKSAQLISVSEQFVDDGLSPKGETPTNLLAPSIEKLYEHAGLEAFELVGKNWEPGNETVPIAILWGFNPWKRQFISDYLPEYRCAFSRTNTSWTTQKSALDKLDTPIFIAWGFNEKIEVSTYATDKNIRIMRMEDGFLRSAALGSEHTIPQSIVLDRTGLYFDSTDSSDIENLLNDFDFSQFHSFRHVKALRKIWTHFGLSKYSLPNLHPADRVFPARLAKRILVVGQVESDASIRKGMAEGWTNIDLIELAVRENVGCEIVYRPHPDVAKGFRADSSKLSELTAICSVVSEDIRMSDLFSKVDHVYTLTSLSGFEALLHGLPVTTVGAPFYSGWGLTDDRVNIPRRTRTLTLDELFCIVYLIYPRYLSNSGDPVADCLSSMLQLIAQRDLCEQALLSTPVNKFGIKWLGASAWWPAILRPANFSLANERYGKNLLSAILLDKVMGPQKSARHYRRFMARVLLAKTKGMDVQSRILRQLKTFLYPDDYGVLLADMWKLTASPVVMDCWVDHCTATGQIENAREALAYMVSSPKYQTTQSTSKPYGPYLKLAQLELSVRDTSKSEEIINSLVLSGTLTDDIIISMLTISKLRFDFSSSDFLLKFYNRYSPNWKNTNGYLRKAENASYINDPMTCLESLAIVSLTSPQTASTVEGYIDFLEGSLGDLPFSKSFATFCSSPAESQRIASARALIALHQPERAEALLRLHQPTLADNHRYCVAMSLSLSYQGKGQEAKSLMSTLLKNMPPLEAYHESLRLAIILGDYAWGSEVLQLAADRDLNISEMYYRKVALGLGQIKESYLAFRKTKTADRFRPYFKGKYVQSIKDLDPSRESAFVVSHVGPGDEIRFASLYRSMQNAAGPIRLTFSCSPRLHNMLARHYSDLDFLPVGRVRNIGSIKNIEAFRELPTSDLVDFFDYDGWLKISKYPQVILSTDALGDVIEDYASFDGKPFLVPDSARKLEFEGRLSAHVDKPIIGISWRSSLTTYSRNEHYLTVQELAHALRALPQAVFVNLQYDECSKELAWLRSEIPNLIVNPEELDQYNDLEGVASLMSCLDLVIAPATTVVEMAGALGIPTLLLSNSSELHWRKLPGSMTDVWHRSVEHVEGSIVGSKKSLIDALSDKLVSRFNREDWQRTVGVTSEELRLSYEFATDDVPSTSV